MRSRLLLCLLCAGLSSGADPTTTKAPTTTTPSPVDQANTDAAQKKLAEKLNAEDELQKDYIEFLQELKDCNEEFARLDAASKEYAKNAAFFASLATKQPKALASANTQDLVTAQNNGNTAGTVKACAEDYAAAAIAERNPAANPAASTGRCYDLEDDVKDAKTDYDKALKDTKEAQKDFNEKAKKAPPTTPKAESASPLQQAAKDAQKAERKAAEELATTFIKINNCPNNIEAEKGVAICAENYKKQLDELKKLIDAGGNNKAADSLIITPAVISAADKARTAAEKPVAAVVDKCKKLDGELATKKKAHEEADKKAKEAQKVAANPSLASSTTAAPTTTTALATSAATSASTSGSSAASSSATTPAAAAASADEGPDATKNVDGVPLTPSSPCCQKAAAGLCKVSMMIRNQCNTECGCVKAKGTCTGKPPKKCTPDGSGSDSSAAEPSAASCTDASSDCAGWAKGKQCSMAKGFWMQNQCTKSCDLCNSGGDVDQYHCWGWAFLGECDKSAGAWMKKYCKLSCANAKKNPARLSLAQRRKMVGRIARARTLKRIRSARRTAVAKIKRRRAKAARAALGKRAGRRSTAARRRRLRMRRARKAARRRGALASARSGRD